jgi:hypothetical protein
MTTTNMTDLAKKLDLLIRPGIKQPNVPFIHSKPGVGKSALIAQHGVKHEMQVMDVRLPQFDSVDIRGIPIPDLADMIARWLPPEMFPFEGTNAFKGTTGILFFDEFNRARPDVMSAAFQLILDRRVGGHKLLDTWFMAAAGNLGEKDNTDVMSMDAATRNRFIHFYVEVELDPWIKWAKDAEIHGDIISFLSHKPEHLYIFNEKEEDSLLVTPRSWEKYSNILKANDHLDPIKVAELIGVDQVGVAHGSFIKYLRDKNSISGRDVAEKFSSDKNFHDKAVKMGREHAYSIVDGIVAYLAGLNGTDYKDKHFSNLHDFGLEVLDRDSYLAMMARLTKEVNARKNGPFLVEYFKLYKEDMKDIIDTYKKNIAKR